MSRSRTGAVLLLLAMFVLGAVVGGVGTSVAERSGKNKRPGGREGYVERLDQALVLTDAQRDSVSAILHRYEPVMDSLWRQTRPHFDSLRQEIRGAIRAQLTPDQAQAYTELNEKRDREYRERRQNGRR